VVTVRYLNIISFSLSNRNHLLGTPDTVVEVGTVPRRLGGSKPPVRVGVSHLAFESLHVHVRLSTAPWNPKPGTSAPSIRARWKVGRDLISGDTFPWGVWKNSEND